MNLEKYEHYFKNILARSFVKNSEKRNTIVKTDEVTNVYIETGYEDKKYIFGKTTQYYFIITYRNVPYEFSIALMHDDPVILLENFDQKSLFLNGLNPKDFLEKLFLMNELQNELEIKKETESGKKKFKI